MRSRDAERQGLSRRRVGGKSSNHRTLDEAGTQAVDVNAVLGVVDGHLLRHSYDGVLGCIAKYHYLVVLAFDKIIDRLTRNVAAHVRIRDEPKHASSIQDPPFRPLAPAVRFPRLLRKHLRQLILAAQPDASLVDGVQAVVIVGADFMGALIHTLARLDGDAYKRPSVIITRHRVRQHTSIVASDIHPATPPRRLLDQSLDIRFLRHVALDESGTIRAVLVLDFLLDACGLEVCDDDSRADFCEADGCCGAQAGRAAGDDCDAAFEAGVGHDWNVLELERKIGGEEQGKIAAIGKSEVKCSCLPFYLLASRGLCTFGQVDPACSTLQWSMYPPLCIKDTRGHEQSNNAGRLRWVFLRRGRDSPAL